MNLDGRRILKISVWILYLSVLIGTASLLFHINSLSDVMVVTICGILGVVYWALCIQSFTAVQMSKWLRYVVWFSGPVISVILLSLSMTKPSHQIDLIRSVYLIEAILAFAFFFKRFT